MPTLRLCVTVVMNYGIQRGKRYEHSHGHDHRHKHKCDHSHEHQHEAIPIRTHMSTIINMGVNIPMSPFGRSEA
jgi:ABC-type nickel/cobalt efflux system permease component RcnA